MSSIVTHESHFYLRSPAMIAEGHPTVAMVFPVEVLLTLDDGVRVHYPAGTWDVPEYLADHYFLKANGVTRVDALPEVDDSVEMFFPKNVKLTADPGRPYTFTKGVNKVPEHLATHSYLRANGVRPASEDDVR